MARHGAHGGATLTLMAALGVGLADRSLGSADSAVLEVSLPATRDARASLGIARHDFRKKVALWRPSRLSSLSWVHREPRGRRCSGRRDVTLVETRPGPGRVCAMQLFAEGMQAIDPGSRSPSLIFSPLPMFGDPG